MASRLVVEAETDPALRVYIPALSLAAAERERAGVAEDLGALPSVNIEGLDFSAAAAVGKRLRTADPADEGKDEPDWSGAHVLGAHPLSGYGHPHHPHRRAELTVFPEGGLPPGALPLLPRVEQSTGETRIPPLA